MSRKTWIVVLAVAFLAPVLAGQSITVTSPAAGNEWPVGATRTITWTSSGVSGPLSIKLRLADQPLSDPPVLEIVASTENDGSHAWTIPPSLAAGEYKVRVRTVSLDPFIYSESAKFKIVAALPPPPAPVLLKLKWPNGREKLILHRDYTISWESNAPETVGNVQLDLMIYKKETEQWMVGVIADNLPATGSHVWKAGEYPGHTAGVGQYRIRVRSMTSNVHSDSSDAPFDLKSMIDQFKKPFSKPVALQKPDLVVCTESVVYSPRNFQCTIHVRVRNIGKATAKAGFMVACTYAGEEPSLSPVPVDIPPGGSVTPVLLKPASYYVGDKVITCFVDPDDQVVEENEDNNQAQCLWSVRNGNLPSNGPLTCSDGSTI